MVTGAREKKASQNLVWIKKAVLAGEKQSKPKERKTSRYGR